MIQANRRLDDTPIERITVDELIERCVERLIEKCEAYEAYSAAPPDHPDA